MSTNKKKTREEWKKEKELEELRKAGTVPALVDEHGRDINPHIPQYIASAPWYIGAEGPTLKHQRSQRENQLKDDYRKRALILESATKYRDGACENCGAMGHKRKDCLERPRKIAARFSETDIAPDELLLPESRLDYDGKRDRWNGFDPEMYTEVIQEYEKVEEAKRLLKEQKLKEDILRNSEKERSQQSSNEEPGEGSSAAGSGDDNAATGSGGGNAASGSGVGRSTSVDSDDEGKRPADDDDEDEAEDDKYADHVDMPGTKVDSKQRITVRNLRIREDVAKYLRNLDPESAYYDPKTRSMRDNPYKDKNKPAEELDYAGDNFVRCSGKTHTVYESQVFAWQAADKGIEVHLQAEPTKTEMLNKQFKQKKEELKNTIKQSALDKYNPKKKPDSSDDDDDDKDDGQSYYTNNSSNWNRCDSP